MRLGKWWSQSCEEGKKALRRLLRSLHRECSLGSRFPSAASSRCRSLRALKQVVRLETQAGCWEQAKDLHGLLRSLHRKCSLGSRFPIGRIEPVQASQRDLVAGHTVKT